MIEGLKEGDQHYWNEFYDMYAERLVGWARYRGLSRSDAEEVVAELLFRLFRYVKRFQYDSNRRFRGYLRRMIETIIADQSKKSEKFRLLLSPANESDHSTTGTLLDVLCNKDQELRELLACRSVLKRCDDRQRRVWSAYLDGSMTTQELATLFGVSVSTINRDRQKVTDMIAAEVRTTPE
tara:strand:+ start:13834 stop:14376 length:543 start_codon:yes stop_codon:yes gene_type:complete